MSSISQEAFGWLALSFWRAPRALDRYPDTHRVQIPVWWPYNGLTEWALNDEAWRVADVFAFGPMVVGAALQVRALAQLLQPESLEATRYRRAIATFLWGLGVMTAGIFVAVFLHALTTTR